MDDDVDIFDPDLDDVDNNYSFDPKLHILASFTPKFKDGFKMNEEIFETSKINISCPNTGQKWLSDVILEKKKFEGQNISYMKILNTYFNQKNEKQG